MQEIHTYQELLVRDMIVITGGDTGSSPTSQTGTGRYTGSSPTSQAGTDRYRGSSPTSKRVTGRYTGSSVLMTTIYGLKPICFLSACFFC
jgi:hypothetical protein